MRYLLDTNTCIAYLNGRSDNVKNNFLTHKSSDIFLCSVVKAELLYGAFNSILLAITIFSSFFAFRV